MGKRIEYQQIRASEFPFHRWENEKLVEEYFRENVVYEFKKHINSLKPEDIMDITEENGLRKYSIVVNFITGKDVEE